MISLADNKQGSEQILLKLLRKAKFARVLIFGRETPVELDFLQVAKL